VTGRGVLRSVAFPRRFSCPFVYKADIDLAEAARSSARRARLPACARNLCAWSTEAGSSCGPGARASRVSPGRAWYPACWA